MFLYDLQGKVSRIIDNMNWTGQFGYLNKQEAYYTMLFELFCNDDR